MRAIREPLIILVLYLVALVGTASAQPHPQAYFAPPPQPVRVQGGAYYPVARPLWIGNALFGPVWVFVPDQQVPQ